MGVSSVVIVNTEASCRVPMQLGPSPGNVDVKERPFYAQELCLQKELVKGVQVLFIDVHIQSNKLKACHRWCTVKLTSVDEMLSIYTEFLRLNRRDVLIIWWFPEGDKQSIVSELRHMYFKKGSARSSFIPNETKWPTIGELVKRNTRLVSLSVSPGVMSYKLLTYGNLTE